MKTRYLAYVLSLALVLCAMGICAQTVFQPKPVEYDLKGVVFATESVFEGRIHMHGFTLGYKRGRLKSYYRTTYQGFELGYLKDGREDRQNKNISISGERLSSSFIYGKRSQFFAFRYVLGEKRYLSEKTQRKGVAVGLIYEGGVSVGLIKPYYLKVIRTEEDRVTRDLEEIKYSDETHEDFLNYDDIYGGVGFFKGFTEVTPTVGLHGKLGMHLGIGAFEKNVKAVEVGLMLDVYPRKIPLLVERAEISNDFFFPKLYMSFQFGRRKL